MPLFIPVAITSYGHPVPGVSCSSFDVENIAMMVAQLSNEFLVGPGRVPGPVGTVRDDHQRRIVRLRSLPDGLNQGERETEWLPWS